MIKTMNKWRLNNTLNYLNKTIKDMKSPKIYLSSLFDFITISSFFLIFSLMYTFIANDFLKISDYVMKNNKEIGAKLISGSNFLDVIKNSLPTEYNRIMLALLIFALTYYIIFVLLQALSVYFLTNKNNIKNIALSTFISILIVSLATYLILLLSATAYGNILLSARTIIIILLSLFLLISFHSKNMKKSIRLFFYDFLPIVVAISLMNYPMLSIILGLLLFIIIRSYKALFYSLISIIFYFLVDSLIIIFSHLPSFIYYLFSIIIFFVSFTYLRKLFINLFTQISK